LTALPHNAAQLVCAPRRLPPLRLRHAVEPERRVEVGFDDARGHVVDSRIVYDLRDRRGDRQIANRLAVVGPCDRTL
jgi:hypothetical protein